MALTDIQINILNLYRRQESLRADLYRAFARCLHSDSAFWNSLVQDEQIHTRIIDKLADAAQKGVLTFEAVQDKTSALSPAIKQIQRLLQRAQQGDIERAEALAAALEIESNLIEKGVFLQFDPLPEKARNLLNKHNVETLNHVVRLREMLDGDRQEIATEAGCPADASEVTPSSTRLVWSEEMSVGIPSIDAQHRFLFGQINELANLRERGASRESLLHVLRRLMKFSDAHFGAEDEVMINSDFPLFLNHRAEHQQYISRLAVFVDEYSRGLQDLPDKMLKFLVAWWLKHVCNSDQKYARWIRNEGASLYIRDREIVYMGDLYPDDI